MGLYSKSISEIVAEKLNKNKGVEEKPEMSKKEMQKMERERLREEKKAEREAAKLAAKEEKKLQREIAKEEKKLKKLEAQKEKEQEEEAVMDVDTVAAPESEPEPKVKTVETVKVKRSRKGGVVKKKGAECKPPSWFVNYVKQMEAAHGVKDQEVVKESAQAKWEQKGMPEKVASEREKHVSRMYKMMFKGN
jgi:hypothetical protein